MKERARVIVPVALSGCSFFDIEKFEPAYAFHATCRATHLAQQSQQQLIRRFRTAARVLRCDAEMDDVDLFEICAHVHGESDGPT